MAEGLMQKMRQKARKLKSETFALYLAYKDPRVPWYAKVIAALVLGYAFSPVDLIPDFIPVLGLLDDLIIVPAGIALVIKLIPKDVFDEHRAAAQTMLNERKTNWIAGAVILGIWVLVLVGIVLFVWRFFR